MVDKLSEYGSTFQTKIFSLLLTDTIFLKQGADLLQKDFFNTEARQKILELIYDYYRKYKTKPELTVLNAEINKFKHNAVLFETVRQELKDAIKHFKSSDLPYIRDETIEFCKNHQIRLAISDSIDLLEVNDFDSIKLRFEAALKIGNIKDIGIDYKEDIDNVFIEETRHPIELPWPVIRPFLDGGGIGAGELGVIAGGPGVGKSWHLVNIAAHFLKLGKNVIFYTLELGESVVVKRFYTLLTGIPTINLKESVSEIKNKINSVIPGNLVVKFYPTGTASMLTIQSHFEEVKSSKFKPDSVFIDYGDLLKPMLIPGFNNKNKRTDQLLADIYIQMRGFAGEYQIPVWTASQIGRKGAKDEIVEGDSISDAYSKLMIADFVMSSQRTRKQKVNEKVTGHIIKNRIGPDGDVFIGRTKLMIGIVEYDELSNDEDFDKDEGGQKINHKEEYNVLMNNKKPELLRKKEKFKF